MKGSFKTALIAAVVSAFVAAGAAVATTQAFTLGTTNTVDAASTVTAGATGLNTKLLELTNNNTGTSATALGLNVATGHAPFAVNSQTRVANLNADKLDGIDSAGFVRGRGTFLANRLVLVPTTQKTLLTIPGLGYLRADCSPTIATVAWINDSGGNVDAWSDLFDSHFGGTTAPNGSLITIAGQGIVHGGTWPLVSETTLALDEQPSCRPSSSRAPAVRPAASRRRGRSGRANGVPFQGLSRWAVPGSNQRPPACKARSGGSLIATAST